MIRHQVQNVPVTMCMILNFLSLEQYLSESSVLPRGLSPLALWLGTKCSFRNTLRCFIYWFQMLGAYFLPDQLKGKYYRVFICIPFTLSCTSCSPSGQSSVSPSRLKPKQWDLTLTASSGHSKFGTQRSETKKSYDPKISQLPQTSLSSSRNHSRGENGERKPKENKTEPQRLLHFSIKQDGFSL